MRSHDSRNLSLVPDAGCDGRGGAVDWHRSVAHPRGLDGPVKPARPARGRDE